MFSLDCPVSWIQSRHVGRSRLDSAGCRDSRRQDASRHFCRKRLLWRVGRLGIQHEGSKHWGEPTGRCDTLCRDRDWSGHRRPQGYLAPQAPAPKPCRWHRSNQYRPNRGRGIRPRALTSWRGRCCELHPERLVELWTRSGSDRSGYPYARPSIATASIRQCCRLASGRKAQVAHAAESRGLCLLLSLMPRSKLPETVAR